MRGTDKAQCVIFGAFAVANLAIFLAVDDPWNLFYVVLFAGMAALTLALGRKFGEGR